MNSSDDTLHSSVSLDMSSQHPNVEEHTGFPQTQVAKQCKSSIVNSTNIVRQNYECSKTDVINMCSNSEEINNCDTNNSEENVGNSVSPSDLVANDSKSRCTSKRVSFNLNNNYAYTSTNTRVQERTKSKQVGTPFRSRTWKNSKMYYPARHDGETRSDSSFQNKRETNVCKFYKNSGQCYYGDNCRYMHINQDLSSQNVARRSRNATNVEKFDDQHSSANRSEFLPGRREHPIFGNNKRNYYANYRDRVLRRNHPSERKKEINSNTDQENLEPAVNKSGGNLELCDSATTDVESMLENVIIENEEKVDSSLVSPKSNKQIILPSLRLGYQLENLSKTEIEKLRHTEISQLMRRFVDARPRQENDETCCSYIIEFKPSDPDWPYEVESINLEVMFPHQYPKECFEAKVDDNEQLPLLLIRHLNKRMKIWIEEKHKESEKIGRCQLLFRPFLHWLDRNLEELFTNGLRATKKEMDAKALGIEFVIYEDLPGAQVKQDDPVEKSEQSVSIKPSVSEINKVVQNDETAKKEENSGIGESASKHCLVSEESTTRTNSAGPDTCSGKQLGGSTPSKRGIEVKFRSFSLGESAAMLSCQKLFLAVQCSRCKTRRDILISAKMTYNVMCEKCHRGQLITFRPDILHQFSAVMGYLDMSDAQPVDIPLMNCEFSITCLNCNKQGNIDGIHYGQQRVTWCTHCNAKMSVFIESAKFHKLQNAQISGKNARGQMVTIRPKAKKVKEPTIQEGKPLPDCGTCQHYKKSFRWLRFPCCGKAYPCDQCHNEKEVDHEMKYATRMICGFCAKEQAYSSTNPCIACNSNVTKKASSHWEGGKGCRDRSKMSRDDEHKYSGKNKTVSNKAASKKRPGNK